jgi:acyl-CoA thioesterase
MFSVASAVQPEHEGRFPIAIEKGWFQGPGAHGGLSAAQLLRAMSTKSPWPVRSLTVQFAAPVPAGASWIEVETVRKGAATTFLSARLVHEDRVCVHAIASFGAERATDLDAALVDLPDVPPSEVLTPADFTGGPVFLSHWEVRLARGAMPFSGASDARLAAWIRPIDPEPVDPMLAVALLDVLPPAILPKARMPRPMATVSLSCHFLAPLPDPGLDPARPLLVDVVSELTHGGYSDQESRLYTPDGRVLAVGRQLVAVVR